MSTSSQMLKGLLDGSLLALIAKGETYGYEMIEKLQQHKFAVVSEGSIYPVLMRLQKNNFVSTELRKSPNGPKRKYYTITAEGEKELQLFKEQWQHLSFGMNSILGERDEQNAKSKI
ncbi:PadR family transcriptional regulator [Oceanobacillus chungangensis]|uniref:PadR family transcriptional regulator n=1 Tax=Oceanobacillus chungangensis TaxID=1229152 RepID=A0A3D8Q0W9_9BACI|nr:PadR family transcriptional regulator [Oceanobacillus chungangensis]RDW21248.1 PadR family transcriptional regulator [Oceanobacillus chungangensis]